MNLLDQYGLVLQDGGGNNQRLTLREILQAVAEDEEARKLIGTAINEAPRASSVESFYQAVVKDAHESTLLTEDSGL